ncbi:MAG: twin-arginine translocase TatA/TatE family subunit [Gammaproteobacteria bacterium]|nr:twin-arginine translocase TatA/TatE family subunit [Gammaproteobacteria bacterium]
MGFGVTELIIILVIVLVLFGAKRLKNVGSDLGSAVKGFKSAIKDEETKPAESIEKSENDIIEGEATKVKEEDKV